MDSLRNVMVNAIRGILEVKNDYDIDHCIDVILQKSKPILESQYRDVYNTEKPFEEWIKEVEQLNK